MKGHLIRHPNFEQTPGCLYYFKKNYSFTEPKKLVVRILADARYKLWFNKQLVSIGPCKSDRHVRYYDEVDLTPFVKKGTNSFFATVLALPSSDNMDVGHMHVAGVLRSGDGYFYLEGDLEDEKTRTLVTDESWVVAREEHDTFTHQFFVGLNEHTTPGFGEELDFVKAQEMPLAVRSSDDDIPFGEILASYATKRPIPQMMYKDASFSYHDGYYDAGELMTGYIHLKAKGKGSITVRYGECFVQGDDEKYVKGDRADTSLHLLGHDDTFEINGNLDFESFWFRTFRFVKITTKGKVTIENFSYSKTGYPIGLKYEYDFGTERRNKLWEISERTLKRCMQETYVDCPYYEQLQYCMDTYSQIQFTYMITSDLRLPKKALRDFGMSWRPGYITEARAPSCKRQYIPGFSLFYIYMLDKYEIRTGDKEEIRQYLPIIDGILDYFEHQKNENGLIKVSDMWDFVDWAPDWTQNEGAPIVEPGYGITVYSLMYVYALRRAARIMELFGRNDTAKEYLARAKKMANDVQKHTYNPELHIYMDSDKCDQRSQHAQIWAVLTDLVTGKTAQNLLKRSESMPSLAGYAYSYILFRAFEHADCYYLAKNMMEEYYGLLSQNCSTIPETPAKTTRSECHAWGAVALYEYTSMTLGVKLQEGPLTIAPYVEEQTYAKGTVETKYGPVSVSWKRDDTTFTLDVNLTKDYKPNIILPEGFLNYVVTLNGEPYKMKKARGMKS